MKYFIKINQQETDLLDYLFSKPLLFAVIVCGVVRARKKNKEHPTPLNGGEFLLSKWETNVFGLEETQNGKLYRAILEAVRLKIFQKTDRHIGSQQGCIYRIIKNDSVYWGREVDSEIDHEQTTNRPRTDHEQTETKSEENEESENSPNSIRVGEGTNQRVVEQLKTYVEKINHVLGTRFHSGSKYLIPLIENYQYWLGVYSPEEILAAVENLKHPDFFMHNPNPFVLLKRVDTKGQPVDYLGTLLNLKKKGDDVPWLSALSK
jgi:hypothetical protein